MTFKQAALKLKRIASGRYHSISFKLTIDHMGSRRTECYVYVDSHLYGEGSTWTEAFEKLDAAMNPKPAPLEQIPDVSDKQEVNNA